jgi:serine/threonine-protein kinase
MARKLINIEKFWHELKRRKVTHVITGYAATAFVILQLVDIVAQPLHLPAWTLTSLIIILCAGFLVVLILSWNYDFTASGVIKTKPANASEQEKKITTSTFSGWKITTYVSLFIIAALIAFNFVTKRRLSEDIKTSEKSIAVLPFKLLSAETDKQYLADGMMDAITLHLSKIKDLRVMSKTSVEQYRETDKTIPIIGKELNVGYILEGSFQKSGENVKLIVQLIKTKKENHIWANEYNRNWNDIFSVQSEVAQKIASELMVVLTPEEVEKMDEKPTENLEAYQAYLRGRYYASQPHFTVQNWDLALQNFQNAAEIDTTFALAFAELAHAHARLIYLRQDLSESRLEKANQAAAKAIKFGSGQPRVHLALGYYYLYAFRDKEQALKQLEIAEKGLPNNVEIMVEKAEIIVTKGQWDEYINLLEKAQQLNPNDASILTDLALGYWYTRRLADNIEICNKAISLAPNSTWPYLYKIFGYWSWKGPCKESRDDIKFINKDDEWYLFSCFWQEVGEGNLQAALKLVSDTTKVWTVNNKMWTIPQSMSRAFIFDYLDEPELARAGYKTTVKFLEKQVAEVPADPRYHSALGIAYAGLGKKEEAIKEGLKAVTLLPVSKDAVYGVAHAQDLAIIYTRLGEYDLAFNQLDQLLSIPSWITPVWIGWEIRFAPLKSHNGYKKLLTNHAIDK